MGYLLLLVQELLDNLSPSNFVAFIRNIPLLKGLRVNSRPS